MPPTIYVIRHAESIHNITKDFSLHDPGLTETGHHQALSLRATFPAHASVGVVFSSPLIRAIETTLDAFGPILGLGDGTDGSATAKLILDPDLQERSDLPCDTGSDPSTLQERFPSVDVAGLGAAWFVKEGAYAAHDEAVEERARKVRRRLWETLEDVEEGKRDVVVVTHGVFMKFLTGDETIDLPKAGWKAYQVEGREDGGEAVLVPVE